MKNWKFLIPFAILLFSIIGCKKDLLLLDEDVVHQSSNVQRVYDRSITSIDDFESWYDGYLQFVAEDDYEEIKKMLGVRWNEKQIWNDSTLMVPCNFAFSDTEAGYSRIFLQIRPDTIIPLIYLVFPDYEGLDSSQVVNYTPNNFTGNLFTVNFEDGYLDAIRYEDGDPLDYYERKNNAIHFRNLYASIEPIFVEAGSDAGCDDDTGNGGGSSGALSGLRKKFSFIDLGDPPGIIGNSPPDINLEDFFEFYGATTVLNNSPSENGPNYNGPITLLGLDDAEFVQKILDLSDEKLKYFLLTDPELAGIVKNSCNSLEVIENCALDAIFDYLENDLELDLGGAETCLKENVEQIVDIKNFMNMHLSGETSEQTLARNVAEAFGSFLCGNSSVTIQDFYDKVEANPILLSYIQHSEGLSDEDRAWIINNFDPESDHIVIKKANWNELSDDERMQHLYKWLRWIFFVNKCSPELGFSNHTYNMERFFTNLPSGTPIIFSGNATLVGGENVPLTLNWNRLWDDNSFHANFGHYGTPEPGQEKIVFSAASMHSGAHTGVLVFYFHEDFAGSFLNDLSDLPCP